MNEAKLIQALSGNSPAPQINEPLSRMFTNLPDVAQESVGEGRRTIFMQPEQTQTQQPVINPLDTAFQSIRDFTSKIGEAKSWEDKQRLMLDMRQNAISHIEKAQEEAKTRIEANLGLPRMREVFQNAQAIAQQQPKYAKDLMTLEQQLSQMENRAQAMTAAALKSNVGIQSFIKTVDNEMSIQEKLIQQSQMLQLKRLEKEEFAKEAAADVLAGVKPEALDTLTQIFPAMKGDNVAIAKFVTSSGKDWKPILDGQIQEDKYLQSALLGHKPSRVMAIVEEAKRTGSSVKSVESQVDYAETLLNNPDLFAKEKARYLGVSEKEMKNEAAKKLLNKESKDELAAQRQKDIGDIEKIMAAKTEQRLQDITTWAPNTSPLADPEGQKIFAELQQKLSRTPNVVEFAKAFVNAPDLTPEIRKTRVQAIQSGYEMAAKASQKTLLHVPISDGQIKDNMRKLEVAAVVDNIASRAGAFIGKNLTGAADITPMANILKFHENVLKSEYNSLESFFNGLVSGGSK